MNIIGKNISKAMKSVKLKQNNLIVFNDDLE